MDKMKRLKFQSSDEHEFEVLVCVAEISITVKNMMCCDCCDESPVPQPNITGTILDKIWEYCKYHYEHPEYNNIIKIISWDKEYCMVDDSTLYDIILAANYMDIKGLLNLSITVYINNRNLKYYDEIKSIMKENRIKLITKGLMWSLNDLCIEYIQDNFSIFEKQMDLLPIELQISIANLY